MLENPINFNKNYKIVLLSTCPKIVQIDEVYINPHVREGFRVSHFFKIRYYDKNKNYKKFCKRQLKIIKTDLNNN